KELTQQELDNQKNCFDEFNNKQKEYDRNQKEYDRNVFLILASLGLVLLIIGSLLSKNLTLQITLMAGGAINTVIGIFRNLQDKLSVFIALGILIIIGGIFVYKKLRD
ncbi:MAG: hypothetical protein AABY22_34715, partial [Nanoarchaeota archaeon]